MDIISKYIFIFFLLFLREKEKQFNNIKRNIFSF